MQANVFNCFKTFANMKISTKEENNVNLISNVKFWHAAKAAVLVIVILTVWGLFSLPAVFYWGQQPANKMASSFNMKCSPVPYGNNESVCYSFLQQYKGCNQTVDKTDSVHISMSTVYISSNVNLQQSESTITHLLSLQNKISPKCHAAILPFMCLYLFPLCDGNQTEYLPSAGECYSISTDTCKAEWFIAQQLFSNLPNCVALPKVSPCNYPGSSLSSPLMVPTISRPNISCSENFIWNGNYCLPACPNWALRSNSAEADDIIVIISAVIGLISGTLFFIVSCIDHKQMFVFPSILVVYQNPIILLLAVLTIINFISPKTLYCTAPDWITTLNHPSGFCALAGSVVVWCLMQTAVIWICHVSLIFWIVVCPLNYMMARTQHRMRVIHALVVLLAILIPAASVAAVFGTGGFINSRFPPLLCLPRNANAGFYALVLPISIITPCAVTLLLAVFWAIRKMGYEQQQNSSGPQKKIMIVFCYYLLLGIISLAAIELNATTNRSLEKSISSYFVCESTAQGGCDQYRMDALKYTFHQLTDTAYVLVSLFPLVNLIYALHIDKWIHLCCMKVKPVNEPLDMASSSVKTIP